MTKIRTMVVDDEPMARERIVGLLNQEKDIEMVGEYSDGTQAVSAIQQQHPDLVFLDVQMPACDGFGVIQQLGEQMPAVVFVTAYDEYALKAFEVHALDYLLKPFHDRRFAAALAHAKERARGKLRGESDNRIAELLKERSGMSRSRFLIPVRDKTIVVDAADIDWIEASDYYVTLHAGTSAHLLRQTMDEIETQLDGQLFFRVHRSTIVNIDRVREIHPLFRGDCALVLADGRRLKLSRSRRKDFEARFARPKR